ncbi:MAG: hypothetical protein M1819_000047 [Sarea resinae]|nr:MAG: hypothetical protein M1819_000047 [Sarea resinae]
MSGRLGAGWEMFSGNPNTAKPTKKKVVKKDANSPSTRKQPAKAVMSSGPATVAEDSEDNEQPPRKRTRRPAAKAESSDEAADEEEEEEEAPSSGKPELSPNTLSVSKGKQVEVIQQADSKKQTAKQPETPAQAGVFDTSSARSVDPQTCLDSLLGSVPDVYESFLRQNDPSYVRGCMLNALSPSVNDLFLDGRYLNLQDLQALGGDFTHTGPGVYMDVIPNKDKVGAYYLYVGQASDIAARMGNHMDAEFRRNKSSLHYFAYERMGKQSTYAMLCTLTGDESFVFSNTDRAEGESSGSRDAATDSSKGSNAMKDDSAFEDSLRGSLNESTAEGESSGSRDAATDSSKGSNAMKDDSAFEDSLRGSLNDPAVPLWGPLENPPVSLRGAVDDISAKPESSDSREVLAEPGSASGSNATGFGPDDAILVSSDDEDTYPEPFLPAATPAKTKGIQGYQMFLNLMEMWGCLLFQTLPESLLQPHLPENTAVPYPGAHLNIAPPLIQYVQGGNATAQRSFNLLAASEDPVVYAYYIGKRRNAMQKSHESKRKTAKHKFLNGGEFKLCKAGLFRLMFSLNKLDVSIRSADVKRLGLTAADKVWATCLLRDDTPPEERLAAEALPGDPALKLSVQVRVLNKDGHAEVLFPSSKGDKFAMKANSLVDLLEGVDPRLTKVTPRRYLHTNLQIGITKDSYTS